MIPSKIFRNRWSALLWAGGILWTAYDVAGAAPSKPAATNAAAPADTDATGVAVDSADLSVLANAIGG